MGSTTRRRLTAGAAVLTVTVALAACSGEGGGAAPSGGGETLTDVTALITPEQNAGFEPFYDQFATDTDYVIDPTHVEVNALVEQLRIQLNSGTAPDVLRVSLGNLTVGVGPLSREGMLADLSDEPWVADIPDTFRALIETDGKIYAYPTSGQSILMFYNKQVFEEAGVEPPTTWDEFIDVNETLKDADVIPISLGLGTPAMVQFIPYMLAATLVAAEEPDVDADMAAGDTSFVEHEGWNEVMEKFVGLIDAGYTTPDTVGVTLDAAMQQTGTGQAAMIPLVSSNSPALYGYFPNGADDVGVFALPATNDASETYIPLSPELLAVNATAENPEGSAAWLEFLSDPERASEYADATNTLPVLAGTTPAPSEIGDAITPYLEEQRFAPFVNHRWPNGDVQSALMQSGQLLGSGGITIAELFAQMDAAYALGQR